jgi:transposase
MANQAEGAQEPRERRGELRHLTRTDPDPRVRRRAQAVLRVEEGQTLAGVARVFHTTAYRVQVWQTRFAVEGRTGLVDRSRRGRPPKLDLADRAFLTAALEQGPQAYDLPVTVWSVRDLQALLERERGVQVSV